MQLVQLYLPDDRSDVLETLDDEGVDYLLSDADDRDGRIVYFPLPDEGVDEVLEGLRDVGLPDDAYTVVVDAETVTTPDFELLREEYAETEEDESLASEQLRDQAEDMNPSWLTFASTAVLSAVVVAAGLLRNSAAAVAGAMVIAPYFGTALSVSVGVVSADRYLFLDGVKHQVVGIGLSVASAAGVGWLARTFALVPPDLSLVTVDQVSIFLTPTLLSLLVATAAGAAGALAFATSTSVTLSGVAIAAAIIPSAGVVGLGVAWHDPRLAAGALSLLLLNVLCVNAAAALLLAALGNHPGEFDFDRVTDIPTRRVLTGVAAALLLSAAVVAAAGATATHVDFRRTATDAVSDTLSREAYDDLAVAHTRVEFVGGVFLPGEAFVGVTVVADDTATYPRLASTLERAVERRTGREVSVRVRYVTFHDGEGTPGAADRLPAVRERSSPVAATPRPA